MHWAIGEEVIENYWVSQMGNIFCRRPHLPFVYPEEFGAFYSERDRPYNPHVHMYSMTVKKNMHKYSADVS